MRLSGAEDLTSISCYSYLYSTVELFLPHIAVAFGFAPSFSDMKAVSFSLDKLFMPNFGPGLSLKMLDSLKLKSDHIPDFLQLNIALWDKLAATFPSPTFNGLGIPNIPSGQTFSVKFPVRGDFPSKKPLLHYSRDHFTQRPHLTF